MVTVELQSVIGNYTKCLHNLSILIILNGRPTSWGRHSQTQTNKKPVTVPVNALPARFFVIHPMHTARACTVQLIKQQHYTVQLQNKKTKTKLSSEFVDD